VGAEEGVRGVEFVRAVRDEKAEGVTSASPRRAVAGRDLRQATDGVE
jgi:hypothetical protein